MADDVSVIETSHEDAGLPEPDAIAKSTKSELSVLGAENLRKSYRKRVVVNDVSVEIRQGEIVGLLGPNGAGKTTVEENIELVLETLPISRADRDHRLEVLLSELDIAYVRHTKAYQLSGGERRRTEIARCLVIEPRFILLDEPFAGIDPIAVIDIQQILQKLRERGIGVLITDHNVRETLAITDRAYIINDGRIFRAGTPAELTQDEEVKRVYLGENFRM